MLTKKQKEDIVAALQSGSGQVVIRPTPKQSGGILGTVLASIGVPLLMKALTGRGIQVDSEKLRRRRGVHVPKDKKDGGFLGPILKTLGAPIPLDVLIGRGLQVDSKKLRKRRGVHVPKQKKEGGVQQKKDGGLVIPYPYQPPPFIGPWQKKHVRSGGGKMKFINKPLSNFDLMDWVKRLGIKYFRGVFSRDRLPKKIGKKECGIVNLDNQIGPGTHWVAYRNMPDERLCEYFDSFGLPMPLEVGNYMATSGKQLEYSGDEIQERDSVLCGYWDLYYLLERQKGRPILDVIHNSQFDMLDRSVNHRFIIDYFKNI